MPRYKETSNFFFDFVKQYLFFPHLPPSTPDSPEVLSIAVRCSLFEDLSFFYKVHRSLEISLQGCCNILLSVHMLFFLIADE